MGTAIVSLHLNSVELSTVEQVRQFDPEKFCAVIVDHQLLSGLIRVHPSLGGHLIVLVDGYDCSSCQYPEKTIKIEPPFDGMRIKNAIKSFMQ